MVPLRISVVDDNPDVAGTLVNYLKAHPGVLGDLDIEYSVHTGFGNNIIDSETILKDKPDAVILDYDLGQNWRNNTGLKIASEIKKKNHYLSLFLMSGIPLSSRNEVITTAMNNRIVDGCFNKPFDFGKIQRTLRKNIRRPLNVGIVGLGQLGRGFMKLFAKSSNVGKVNAYSESMQHLYPIIGNLEWVRNSSKISLKENLEDALEGTDCILICTSAMRGASDQKVAKTPNRSDLFSVESEKIHYLSDQIAKLGYKGMIMYLTNPVGESLELSRRTGLDPDQLTSPFTLDEARIRMPLKDQLRGDYDTIKNNLFIVGEHGAPDVYCSLRVQKDIRKAIENAKVQSQKTPEDSMIAHAALGAEYEVQAAYMPAIRSLAHFKTRTPYSAYCYCEFGGEKGYIAVPHEVSFSPNIRITPDQERIGQLSENLKNRRFVRILDKQNKQVQQYLSTLN